MDAVTIPVIASSGAGSAEHFAEVFQVTGVQAVSLRDTGELKVGGSNHRERGVAYGIGDTIGDGQDCRITFRRFST